MIKHEEVVLLVEKNPNDMKLGEKIRQLYLYDSENPYRHEDSMPDLTNTKLHGMGDITDEPAYRGATDNNPQGTSVTSIDDQMEEVWTQIEKEEIQRFPGTNSKDYTVKPEKVYGYDANGSPVEEEIDITSAYTRNPHPRTGI